MKNRNGPVGPLSFPGKDYGAYLLSNLSLQSPEFDHHACDIDWSCISTSLFRKPNFNRPAIGKSCHSASPVHAPPQDRHARRPVYSEQRRANRRNSGQRRANNKESPQLRGLRGALVLFGTDLFRTQNHSHSIVAGGFPEMS